MWIEKEKLEILIFKETVNCPKTLCPLDDIKRRDRAWFKNVELEQNKEKFMVAFDNIECMTLERRYNLYFYADDEMK